MPAAGDAVSGVADEAHQSRGPDRGWVQRVPRTLIALTTVAAALRLWRLGDQSFSYDEWLTTEAISGGLWDVVRHVANREGIGPAYPLLMWLWSKPFGDGEVALRLVSAAFGIATVPVAYVAVVRLGLSRLTAGLAGLLVAVHPMLVWYSQEARPYSLLALLGGASLLASARVRDGWQQKDFLVWGAVGALGVSVHYFFVFLVASEAAALWVLGRRWQPRLLVGLTPVAATLALLTPLAMKQRTHANNSDWISDWSRAYRLADAGKAALVGVAPPVEWLWIVALAVLAVAVAALAVTRPQHRLMGAMALAVGACSVGLGFLATVVGPDVFVGRYLIAGMLPLVVGGASGLGGGMAPAQSWALRLTSVVAVAVFCVASLLVVARSTSDSDVRKPDWNEVAASFDQSSQDRLLVVQPNGLMAWPLRHYVEGARKLDADDSARVSEIDVVVAGSIDGPCNLLSGQACGFLFVDTPLTGELGKQFALERTIELDQFSLKQFRSDEPVEVTYRELDAVAGRRDAIVLVAPD